MSRGSAPSHRGPAYLTVIINHVEVQRRPIAGLSAVIIGRGLDCDLWLEDPVLSRKHCQLEPALEGDGWAITDLNSRNGTYVNAKRLMERQALNHKDVITIGKTHVVFHAYGYVPPRPSDPGEALLMPARTRAAIDARIPTPHHSTRPLPTPQVSIPSGHDSTIAPSPGETLAGSAPPPLPPQSSPPTPPPSTTPASDKPLPFTRPPARPIVKPVDEDHDADDDDDDS
jgi:predicted component of type VI protein secretion system